MKSGIAVVVALTMLAVLVGCGSGGSDSPGGTRTATLAGTLQTRNGIALPTTLQAMVVGTSISASVRSDATFTLVGVPLGNQTIGVVNTTDPTGALVSVEVVDVKEGVTARLPAPTAFTPSSTSAIAGIVYEGPIAPVDMPGQPDTRPYAGATLQIKTLAGTLVASVTSQQDGTFSVEVAPGLYEFVPVSGSSGFPHANSFLVSVQASQTSNIVVDYDTGIR